MKIVVLFSIVIVMAACNKKSQDSSVIITPPQKNVTPHFISVWWNNDTMISQYVDTLLQQREDTLYTYNINDTSFIIYKGVKLYVWAQPIDTLTLYQDNFLPRYKNICISTKAFDTANAISFNLNNEIRPYKYYLDGSWHYQYQQLNIPNFYSIRFSYNEPYLSLSLHYGQ